MNKKILPLAISAAMALPLAAVAEGPVDGKVYGKINMTLDNVDNDAGDSVWELNSNASRIGFKGNTNISGALDVIYKLEYEVDASGEADGIIKNRNQYVGLKGTAGTIFAGVHDTPLKLAQGKVDLFGDLQGDIKNIFTGENGENRKDNIVFYKTPDFNGFSVSAATLLQEEADDMSPATEEDNGLFDVYSASLNYSNDMFYGALAVDSEVDGWDQLRAVGQLKMNAFTVGAIYQDGEEVDGDDEQTGWVLSGSYKFGNWKLEAQYGDSELEDATATTEEVTSYSLGAEYKLAKATKLFGYYTSEEEDVADTELTVFGLGIEHKF